MKPTKKEIISYLVDCLGYSEDQDLKETLSTVKWLSYNELMGLVDDKEDLKLFIGSRR